MRRTLVSVALVAMVLARAACVADPPPPQQVSPSGVGIATATPPSTLNGRTVRIAYDGGNVETLTVGPDGKSVTYIVADVPSTAPAAIEPLETGVFLVTWTRDGTVISQVQDFRTGEMRGTWSHRPDPNAPQIVETRSGSVRLTQ
ncbi:MoaF-related domain-containing protein [Nocardia sp. NPDC050406]|uniref:MoaF-related domain-containing protein n=1 Tax=Nocardia sp. NPDC050406 TaxID=3364318 RepID=UPI0037B41048